MKILLFIAAVKLKAYLHFIPEAIRNPNIQGL